MDFNVIIARGELYLGRAYAAEHAKLNKKARLTCVARVRIHTRVRAGILSAAGCCYIAARHRRRDRPVGPAPVDTLLLHALGARRKKKARKRRKGARSIEVGSSLAVQPPRAHQCVGSVAGHLGGNEQSDGETNAAGYRPSESGTLGGRCCARRDCTVR